MWRSVSSFASTRGGPARFVVIGGGPECRRVLLFQAALARQGLPPARVVSYEALLACPPALAQAVRPGTTVRIESPGKSFEVERALLAAGAEAAAGEPFAWLSPEAVSRLAFERGRILPARQWYLGFCRALDQIRQQLAACPDHALMSQASEIEVMFDKPLCHRRLAAAGIPVPRCLRAGGGSPAEARGRAGYPRSGWTARPRSGARLDPSPIVPGSATKAPSRAAGRSPAGLPPPALSPVASYEELMLRMREAGCSRVFVKLAHGSSASGVVAYRTDGRRHSAATTVEMIRRGGELLLYNSRRIRVYREPREIAALIDALCAHRVHVEEWIPKAGLDGGTFDLRVVVIGGRARQIVARLSHSPMTNLHLLNERRDPAAVRERMGPAAWEAALRTCEQVMCCFPGSLYAGIDLLIASDFRRHAVLEVNAFGDLLPDLLCEGEDTYALEIAAMLEREPVPSTGWADAGRERVGEAA